MDEDVILGKILRRYLTENEPNSPYPAYAAIVPSRMTLTLDGKVSLTEEELDAVKRVLN